MSYQPARNHEAAGRGDARRAEQRVDGGLDDQAVAMGGHGFAIERIVLKKIHRFRYYKSHPQSGPMCEFNRVHP
jgi:hypothetical protein